MHITVLVALCLSLGLNWLVRHVARTRGWLSAPASKRHIHKLPVPRLGGVGVFLSFALVLLFTASRVTSSEQHDLLLLLIPATLIFSVGLVDDIRHLSARTKLFFQIVAGVALFFIKPPAVLAMSVAGWSIGPFVICVVTVAWVVLVSNSINLIDGVDGLAGGTAALSLAAVGVILFRSGNHEGALFAGVLLGAVLGFLRFNFHPATMFLGDSGSLFLGFMISALGMQCASPRALASTLSVPVAILALPLTETGVSVLRRFLSGRPLFTPDREHIHHKLLDKGFTQRQVALCLYVVSVVSAIAGVLMTMGNDLLFHVSSLTLIGIILIGVAGVGYLEFFEIARIVRRISEQRQVIANDVVLRKLAGRITKTRCLGELQHELRAAFIAMKFDGFQLMLMPAYTEIVACEYTSRELNWGYTVQTRPEDPSTWSMAVDLVSEQHGKLAWVRLARRSNRGSMLFDANLLVGELQQAMVAALERCVTLECPRVNAECIAKQRSVKAGAPYTYTSIN